MAGSVSRRSAIHYAGDFAVLGVKGSVGNAQKMQNKVFVLLLLAENGVSNQIQSRETNVIN
jgi:hypothetical protein